MIWYLSKISNSREWNMACDIQHCLTYRSVNYHDRRTMIVGAYFISAILIVSHCYFVTLLFRMAQKCTPGGLPKECAKSQEKIMTRCSRVLWKCVKQANFLNIIKKLKPKKTRPPKKLKAIFCPKTKCVGNFWGFGKKTRCIGVFWGFNKKIQSWLFGFLYERNRLM